MKITLMGTGQVGLVWAEALSVCTDIELSLSDPYPSERALAWAGEHGMELHREVGSWIADAELVLLCVPGKAVPAATAAVLPQLESGAVVVDLSTAGADTKREAAAVAAAAGIGYVDIAITGAVGIHGVRTPLLYAGALEARVERVLVQVQAPLTVLPDSAPGDAVAVKLLRSVIMKGLEALAVEALPAAQSYGVLEQLLTALGDVDRSSFAALLQSMVTSHPQHAARRHAEVLEAADQLDRAGYPHELTDQVSRTYAATVAQAEAKGTPETSDLETVLNWYRPDTIDPAAHGPAQNGLVNR